MTTIAIRPAVAADLGILYQFEQGVIQSERPFDSTLGNDPIHYYDFTTLLSSEHIQLVVAETNGSVIASGYARIENAQPYLRHTRHAYLGFMYVVPEYRGMGVNQKILKYLEDWALAKNITELRLEVYYENKVAIHAYEKAGFTNHMIEMRLPISPEK